MKKQRMGKVRKDRLLTWLLAGVLGVGVVITPSSLTAQPAVAQSGMEERKMAVVGLDGAPLQDAPGGRILAELAPGAVVDVTARTADKEQLRVKTEDDVEGWVRAEALVVVGVDELPIVTARGGAEQPLTAVLATPITTTVGAPVAPTVAATAPLTHAGNAALVGEELSLASAGVSGAADVPGTRLNVRSGPGTQHSIVGKAGDGEKLALVARSQDGAWLQVVRDDLPEGAGWVATERVRVEGNVSELSVSAAVFGVSAPADSLPMATVPGPAPAATPMPTAPAEPDAAASAGATGLTGTLVFQAGRGSIYAYALERGRFVF